MEKVGSGQTGGRVRCFAIPAGRKRSRAGLGLPTLLPLAIALNESFHFADKTARWAGKLLGQAHRGPGDCSGLSQRLLTVLSLVTWETITSEK